MLKSSFELDRGIAMSNSLCIAIIPISYIHDPICEGLMPNWRLNTPASFSSLPQTGGKQSHIESKPRRVARVFRYSRAGSNLLLLKRLATSACSNSVTPWAS